MSWVGHFFAGVMGLVIAVFGPWFGSTPTSTVRTNNPPLVIHGSHSSDVSPATQVTSSSRSGLWIPAPVASATDGNSNYGFVQYQDTIFYNGEPRPELNPKTFLVWHTKSDNSYGIGKDRQCIYFENNKRCEDVDWATFTPLGSGMEYAIDKNHAYWLQDSGGLLTYMPIEGANPASFGLAVDPFNPDNPAIGEVFARDISSVYYGGKMIQGADPQTFKIVGPDTNIDSGVYENQFETDKNRVYCGSIVVAGMDPNAIVQSTSTPGIVIALTKAQEDACFPPIRGQY